MSINVHRLEFANLSGGGYQVVIDGGGAGKTKYFSDAKHGGKKHAERAANSYRDALVRLANGRHEVPDSRNKSGVRGVRIIWKETKKGWAYLYVQSLYRTDEGEFKLKAFSIEKHGPEHAIREAVRLRRFSEPVANKAVQTLMRLYKKEINSAGA